MFRSKSLILALAALLISALNPPGYMASANAEGITISICSGRGVDSAVIARDDPRYEAYAAIYGESDDSSHGSDKKVRDGCSFSGPDTHALTPVDAPLLCGKTPTVSNPSGLAALAVRTPRSSPPSTGPPANT